jgi:uncharacterized protein YqiB (DUF1249 family)
MSNPEIPDPELALSSSELHSLAPPAERVSVPHREMRLNSDRITGLSPLAYLQALQEENFKLLQRLLGSTRNFSDSYLAFAPGGVPLWLEVLEQQAHTAILRITHSYHDAPARLQQVAKLVFEPNAVVRVYFDTQQAEVTHFDLPSHAGQDSLIRHSGLRRPNANTKQRVRLASFLQRWMLRLLEQGFGPHSFQAASRP